MSVGTGTALAIGLGASTGANLLGAKKQASAAKQAAATQSASADRAMALQSQMLGRAMAAQEQQNALTNQLYAPYTRSAPMSLAALNNFVLGGGEGYYAPGSFALSQQAVRNPAFQPAPTLQPYGMPPMKPPMPGMMGGPPSIQPRQFGGPVNPGQPYLVGEAGPEVMIPSRAGTIRPMRNPQVMRGWIPQQPIANPVVPLQPRSYASGMLRGMMPINTSGVPNLNPSILPGGMTLAQLAAQAPLMRRG